MLHLRLNLQTFLPGFAIIEEASCHDNRRTLPLCAALQAGEITIFDKAYVHFVHLCHLDERGVFWATRARENMSYRVSRKHLKSRKGKHFTR